MKIDRTKLKKSSSELPEACRLLIERLKGCKHDEGLLRELASIHSWDYGKSELFHWVDVLDILDEVMERAVRPQESKWALACDDPTNCQLKELLLHVIRFTSLLIEHSFQRYFYYSMEHLISLLSSCDMNVVLEVLNVLYVFSKRSNFITRLGSEKKAEIMQHLNYLAESWGGKENGFGLAECCQDVALSAFPSSSTTLHFEFYTEDKNIDSSEIKGTPPLSSQPITTSQLCVVHMENIHEIASTPAEVMQLIVSQHPVPREKQTLLFTHCRLAHSFASFGKRLKCVLARLQAISVLVYSNAVTSENSHQVIYSGFISELVDVLELSGENLVETKAAVLRTLTSILHLERNPKLEVIIESTGANTYHGFLPCLARRCIQHMVEPHLTPFPHMYSTALFSFLYHLASYENGGEALLTCGVMASLLKLIGWLKDHQEHITFVTRAVRIVDLITNIEVSSFESHNGMAVFIQRLQHEVDLCRKEQPFVIRPKRTPSASVEPMSVDQDGISDGNIDVRAEGATGTSEDIASMPAESPTLQLRRGLLCLPQRAALLKSILNFLKKAIPDPSLSDSIRHLMDGNLPKSLKHIISNAEYYGPSLLLLAMDVVTVFVFQEPSLLSSLQDKGLTDVILHALLVKDVPATREVLAALPNVFSALCLNARGLEAFVEYKPFDKLFQVLLSPEYLPAMKRRKHSLTLADTANNLGTAMDELMRHQPALRSEAIKAIVGLLKEILRLGRDPNCICQSVKADTQATSASIMSSPAAHSGDLVSSDDDDEESSNISVIGTPRARPETVADSSPMSSAEPLHVPLMDYILNVMKFVDAIMSNNTTDDHCKEFIIQGGLTPIMEILRLPNLPLDFPSSPACQAVSSVCTVLLKLCHEQKVLKEGLEQLEKVLDMLDSLYKPLPPPGGSALLHELANSMVVSTSTSSLSSYPQTASSVTAGSSSSEPSLNNTPLLHALSATHAYVKMFVHVCRLGQSDIRTISVNQWGSEIGQRVLKKLSQLYLHLVWEGTVLIALCSDDAGEMLPINSEFGKADLAKLSPKDILESDKKDIDMENSCSVGVTAAMESLTTSENLIQAMELDEGADEDSAKGDGAVKKKKLSPTLQMQIKQIKPLLNVSSRLGGSLAELFGVLVKLCVGSPLRQRRTHQSTTPLPVAPSPAARAVTNALCQLAKNGLSWQPPTDEPLTRMRLTFLMCSVSFTVPMLFDDSKFAYHLMLQEFWKEEGHIALFRAVDTALGSLDDNTSSASFRGQVQSDVAEVPDSIAEFLDAWLILAEKLVHSKNLMDSTYALPAKLPAGNGATFDPIVHLKGLHKPIFDCILKLWNRKFSRNFGEQIASSLLLILCHIFTGEKFIAEKEGKKTAEVGAGSLSVVDTPAPSAVVDNAVSAQHHQPSSSTANDVNQDHLRQLVDMGFTRGRCVEALRFANNLEQATEYLLAHASSVPAGATGGLAMDGVDAESAEDEAMLQAIAMSLQGLQTVAMSVGSTTEHEEQKLSSKGTTMSVTTASVAPQREELLSSSALSDFTQTMLPGCLQMLDNMPAMVFKVKELLGIVALRNGISWREEMLKNLTLEMCETGTQLIGACSSGWCSQTSDEAREYFTKNNANVKLAVRIHLFSLLLQDMEMACIDMLHQSGFIDVALSLLEASVMGISIAKSAGTPRWLAPLMLILDQYERTATVNRRKNEFNKVLAGSTTWKWFDDRNGRWCPYNNTSNKLIDAAYRAGEPSVRFAAGRRKYSVQFGNMLQLNEETGNRRPVMLCLPTKEEKDKFVKEKEKGKQTDDAMDTTDKDALLDGLNPDQISKLIKMMVRLISIPIDSESLHAIMRLCLRFTREQQFAREFATLGGCTQLMRLTQSSAFVGFTSLATLLIRHVLEEDNLVLQAAAEQVVQEVSLGLSSGVCGVSSSSTGSREINYVLRQLGPAACRNGELVKNAVIRTLRLSSTNIGANEPSWSAQQPVELVRAIVLSDNVASPQPSPGSIFAKVITELLDCLTISTFGPVSSNSVSQEASKLGATSLPATTAKDSSNVQKGSSCQAPGVSSSLLSKSDILRMLAEFVLSYPVCVDLIVHHTYTCCSAHEAHQEAMHAIRSNNGSPDNMSQAAVPTEHGSSAGTASEHSGTATRSILAYMLDYLLPTPSNSAGSSEKDCGPLAHVLLAALAASSHSMDTQTSLVSELKAALQRSLAEPESSSDKYTRIQALAGLTSTLLDACTALSNSSQAAAARTLSSAKGGSLSAVARQPGLHPVIRLLIKKGLMADLAKVPHSIELSSPAVVATVNAILKPLETLTRIINQPQLVCSLADDRKKLAVRTEASPVRSAAATATDGIGVGTVLSTIQLPGSIGETVNAGSSANLASVNLSGTTESMPGQAGGVANWQARIEGGGIAASGSNDFDDDEGDLNVDEISVPHEATEDDPVRHQHPIAFESQAQAVLEQVLEEILSQGVSEDDAEEREDLARGNTRSTNDRGTLSSGTRRAARHLASGLGAALADGDPNGTAGGAASGHSSSEDEDGDGDVDHRARTSSSPHSYVQDQRRGDPQAERDEQEDDTIHGESGNENEDDIDDDDDDEEDGAEDDEESDDEHAAYEEEPDEEEEEEGSLADILGMDDRDDDLDGLGLQNYPQRVMGQHFVLGGSTGHVRAFELPLAIHDGDARNDDHQGTVVPPAPSSVPTAHPLMTASSESRSLYSHGPGARAHRRVGGAVSRLLTGRYQIGGTAWQPSSSSQPLNLHLRMTGPGGNAAERMTVTPVPAVVLWQRIFGSSTAAADILHLTNAFSANGSTNLIGETSYGRRLMMTADDDEHVHRLLTSRIATESDVDDRFSEMLQDGFDRVRSSGPTILSSIPSTLFRWMEESRVLDGNSAHDAITVLKPEILEALNRFKQEEQDKQKKSMAEGTQEKQTATAGLSGPGESSDAAAGSIDQPPPSAAAVQLAAATGGTSDRPAQSAIATPIVTADQLIPASAVVWLAVGSDRQLLGDVDRTDVGSSRNSVPVQSLLAPLSDATMSTSQASAASRQGVEPNSTDTSVNASVVSSAAVDATETLRPALLSPASDGLIPTRTQGSSENERAFTPPNIFVDGDEPAPPPELPGIPDMPVPFPEHGGSLDDPWVQQEGGSVAVSVVTGADGSIGALAAAAAAAFTASSVSSDPTPGSSREEPQTSVHARLTAAAGASVAVASAPADDAALGLEGVDPSFLAALPESIRQEVIAEQLRLQRIQRQAREQSTSAAAAGTSHQQAGDTNVIADVSPEFLAALPPNIQEEVLAQQRAEQARRRHSAAVDGATSGTDQPGPSGSTDPTGFLNSLPTSLRQQVLADMDDSQIALLPADLMAEAQLLRQELEERHRRLPPLLQERLFAAPSGAATLSTILRHSAGLNVRQPAGFWRISSAGRTASGAPKVATGFAATPALLRRGKQLLDQDALTCLLVLLFLHEPRLNVARLHRVLKNVAYHAETFNWIIQALMAVIAKTAESSTVTGSTGIVVAKGALPHTSWLSFGLDAALGCRANIFQVKYPAKKSHLCGNSSAASSVCIHPQAAQLVCEHALDLLVFLSKSFPNQFLPSGSITRGTTALRVAEVPCPKEVTGAPAVPVAKARETPITPHSRLASREPSFWDVLVRLDQTRISKKGKASQKGHSTVSSSAAAAPTNSAEDDANPPVDDPYEQSPFGQLMSMLSHPIIRRSQTLTDRLLKLLSAVSEGISDLKAGPPRTDASAATSQASSTNTVATGGRQIADTPLLSRQLQLAVEILTSKSCSEEGLEDATTLLLRLSRANEATRLAIVRLLLAGAHEIGMTVCGHIRSLLTEVRELDPSMRAADPEDAGDDSAFSTNTSYGSLVPRGFGSDRHSRGVPVIGAPSKMKGLVELQLSSMAVLTSKSSSQYFLLRLLKVIIQLKEKSLGRIIKETSSASILAAGTVHGSVSTNGSARPADGTVVPTAPAIVPANNGHPSDSQGVGSSCAEDDQLTQQGGSVTSTQIPIQTPAASGVPMEVDAVVAASSNKNSESAGTDSAAHSGGVGSSSTEELLSEQLLLDELWETIGLCLTELAQTHDSNAVLVLQPAVEAFFLVHAGQRDSNRARRRHQARERREDQLAHLNVDELLPSPAGAVSEPGTDRSASAVQSAEEIAQRQRSILPIDTQKFLRFAETHRTVLNQILRQSSTPLADGPFSVLVDHMKLLDFDVKRQYFRQALQRLDESSGGGRRGEDLAVHVRRDHVFEDSYRELFRRTPEEWQHRFYIVFEGEEGQDAGGLLREWYMIMSREIFNPNYALFMTTAGDRVTYTINPSSHYNSEHLSYFKFVGRVIAKAIHSNKLLECYFTRSFYKHITGQPVTYMDMEAEDYSFYQGLVFLLENDPADLGSELSFSTEIQEFGVTEVRDLKTNGRNLLVTEENKKEYVKLVCQMKMTGAIRKQLDAFLEGFYDIIPKYLISIFNEQELELLISGLPTIDVDDLKANTEYHKYNANSLQIQWFWRALRSFDQAERARFLQFVTGTSKVPLQGFAFLEGMNGVQKLQIHRDDRSTDRLPCAHTCFNQLDLPAYETYDKLRRMLLLVINECSEGFGLA